MLPLRRYVLGGSSRDGWKRGSTSACRKEFQVMNDRMSFSTLLYWEEFSVSQRAAARSIQADNILIELFYFDNTTSLVPFKGMSSSLILDVNMILYREWWQSPSVKGPSFSSFHMTVPQSFFSFVECVNPGRMRFILAR